ncbi:hypothetical protein M0R72_14255 [Candidatus Pacearchaeota archaeon]|jgi:hypothetical protein|nr:hypothetical protein [Candidatus Pacearchaeota archaeon]
MISTPKLDASLSRLETLIEKFNPNHDRLGRFATGGGTGGMAPDTGGSFGGGGSAGPALLTAIMMSNHQAAIDFYTETKNFGYRKIRNCQNKQVGCTEQVKQHIDNLHSLFSVAPKFDGVVYRGLPFSSGRAQATFLAKLEKSGELENKGFTSNIHG